MQNFEYCAYTYRHRRAIEYLIEKLIPDGFAKSVMKNRAIAHDMDKVVMYQFMSKKDASKYHRKTANHHMGNGLPKTYYDMLEAILDYESAGYTKPDKPLNAFDTVNKMKSTGELPEDICNNLLMICANLGIASSYSVTEDRVGMEHLSQFEAVTEEMIGEDIAKCIHLFQQRMP